MPFDQYLILNRIAYATFHELFTMLFYPHAHRSVSGRIRLVRPFRLLRCVHAKKIVEDNRAIY